jgi:hypothetical protein
MNFLAGLFLRFGVLSLISFAGGCCCCDISGIVNRGGTNTPTTTTPPADPEAAEELATGTDYAQKALNAKGYGDVYTANLRKDGLYWYVEGTAEGKEGGTINYVVMFNVSRFENRQTWSVQTVSVDGEVVYP